MDARLIRNDNGTYRLVDLEGNDLMMEWKIGDTVHKTKIQTELTQSDLWDLQYYGVNIINPEDLC